MILALPDLIKEWLECDERLYHFYVDHEGMVRCPCAQGWFVKIQKDHVWIPTKVKIHVNAANPELLMIVSEYLMTTHKNHVGELRGRPA